LQKLIELMIKKMISRPLLVLLIAITLAAVTDGCVGRKRKIRKLDGFDADAWILDKNGCSGQRMKLKDQLLKSKHYMRGLQSDQIEAYLGKPDAQELYSRSQRYYIYFIDPGPKCDIPKEQPLALFVRFSAVGIANEFTIRPL
jgi:hypothetical protein